MSKITLPSGASEAHLRAFSMAMIFITALIIGPFLIAFSTPLELSIILLGCALSPALGMWKPGLASLPYRVWNKLAASFARGAQIVITAMCFGVFSVVGQAGSCLILDRPNSGQSMWRRRSTLSASVYGSQGAVPSEHSGGESFFWDFTKWAIRSHNSWAIFLIPFFACLLALETEQAEAPPTDIYTLF